MSFQTGSIDADGMARTSDGKLYVTLGSGSTIPSPTFTGQIKADNGTIGAPSYTFTSDPTSGVSLVSGLVLLSQSGATRLNTTTTGIQITGTLDFGFGDLGVSRVGANNIRFGPDGATTTSRTEINKAVTAFTNAVAKTVFTVTIPNAAHHAVIELEVQGALGAGGAIGAGEAMATNSYKIAIVRTAGVATVATATAASNAVAVAVAGANTVTATAAVTAMSGAVGATQTFDIQVTITKNAGTSDNHTALVYAKLMNANASGVTIS